MNERDFVWVFATLAVGLGLYLLVFADPVTERDKQRSAQARQKYGHRPAILRPKIANQRPSALQTRLAGVGFLAIGGFGLFSRLVDRPSRADRGMRAELGTSMDRFGRRQRLSAWWGVAARQWLSRSGSRPARRSSA